MKNNNKLAWLVISLILSIFLFQEITAQDSKRIVIIDKIYINNKELGKEDIGTLVISDNDSIKFDFHLLAADKPKTAFMFKIKIENSKE